MGILTLLEKIILLFFCVILKICKKGGEKCRTNTGHIGRNMGELGNWAKSIFETGRITANLHEIKPVFHLIVFTTHS